MPAKPKKKGSLPYSAIQNQFTALLTFVGNKLEREWHVRYQHVNSAGDVLAQEFRNALNTFHTIFYICSDNPKDPHRLPKFALSLPPLTRTLFEQLIMYVFLLEDVDDFIPWLFKTGYTETRAELDHCQKYHGRDTNWKKYIRVLKKRIAEVERTHGLTKREIANPKRNIGRGPTPGLLLSVLKENRPRSKSIWFIEYITSWLYRELSGQAHLNIIELAQRGALFSTDHAKQKFGAKWEEKRDEQLENYRQRQIFLAITLMLAMATELQSHFHDVKLQDTVYLWTVLNEYSDMTKDFWDTRYSRLLL